MNYRYSLILLLVLRLIIPKASAQTSNNNYFIGLNPSVTQEPFYEKSEFDVNIFPLVFQRTITKRMDLRFIPLINYGIRDKKNGISHLGLEFALPVFIKKKENRNELSKGFYFSPIVSMSRNILEFHSNYGLWLEPGYNILFSSNFALSIGLQIGATYLDYDQKTSKWDNHFGVKVVLGKWLTKR